MKTIYTIMLSILILSCKNTNDKVVVFDEKQETIDSMKMQIEKHRIIDSMREVELNNAKKREVLVLKESNTTNKTTERKKWSGAAKGAVIGAGVGAITGAIVSEKKGEGAVIGGLAGAGVGAGTGAIIDDKKKK